MDVLRAGRQLVLIAETTELAADLGLSIWLRGGWAVDFFLGDVTRDHVDIDWFAWADDASALDQALREQYFQPLPGPPPRQQLDYQVSGLEISFALLARDEAGRTVVAGGPFAGQPWPAGMLEGPPGTIDSQSSPIISPQAQIEIKQMMPVWVPGRPRRRKDADDIALLQAALRDI